MDAGATGGELSGIAELRVQRLDGTRPGHPHPAAGLALPPGAGTWEDDDHLVTVVVEDGSEAERMVRCSPDTQECVLLDSP